MSGIYPERYAILQAAAVIYASRPRDKSNGEDLQFDNEEDVLEHCVDTAEALLDMIKKGEVE